MANKKKQEYVDIAYDYKTRCLESSSYVEKLIDHRKEEKRKIAKKEINK